MKHVQNDGVETVTKLEAERWLGAAAMSATFKSSSSVDSKEVWGRARWKKGLSNPRDLGAVDCGICWCFVGVKSHLISKF